MDRIRESSKREEQTLQPDFPSNENKMSDGWRESASLRVEGGIS
jgi:hypothetical protein